MKSVTKPAIKRQGHPGRMGVAATPKSNESAFWKDKEREEFGGFNKEFLYHHALFIGHNITNTFYTTIKAVKESRALPPEKV